MPVTPIKYIYIIYIYISMKGHLLIFPTASGKHVPTNQPTNPPTHPPTNHFHAPASPRIPSLASKLLSPPTVAHDAGRSLPPQGSDPPEQCSSAAQVVGYPTVHVRFGTSPPLGPVVIKDGCIYETGFGDVVPHDQVFWNKNLSVLDKNLDVVLQVFWTQKDCNKGP